MPTSVWDARPDSLAHEKDVAVQSKQDATIPGLDMCSPEKMAAGTQARHQSAFTKGLCIAMPLNLSFTLSKGIRLSFSEYVSKMIRCLQSLSSKTLAICWANLLAGPAERSSCLVALGLKSLCR